MKTWKYIASLAFAFAVSSEAAMAAPVSFVNPTMFGDVNVGSTKTITYTVKNTSSTQVRLDSYWFNGSSAFKLTGGTCKYDQSSGFIVKASKTCTVNIQFAPTSAGDYNGQYVLGYYPGKTWTWTEASLPLTGKGISPTPPPPTEPLPPTTPTQGWLRVEGNKIVDDQGLQVVLKGVNIADPEHLNTKTWERPGATARTVANLATDQYFAEVVRLPILPGNANYPDEGWFSTTNGGEKYFNSHVKPLVDELTAKGIYVIIDLHYVSDYQNLWPRVQQFWSYMAPKFANNPYVIYEIFNEPILPDNWSTWKTTIAQPAVNLIRSVAPQNLILVGGPYWSSHMAGAATDPVAGSNLVYVGHVYANQTETMWNNRYLPVIQKYPMFFTEWGFETGGTEGGDLSFGTAFESWMRKYNTSWTVWSFDTLWGPRMFNSDWTLKGGTGGEGVFVRDLLLEEHNR